MIRNAHRWLMILIVALPAALSGQGVIVDQPKLLFSNERTAGVFLNSNGFGADFRFARFMNATNDRLYEVSFDYVKHPKEFKSVVAYDIYTRRFVYGKQNQFWELKGQYGNQHELFRKYDFSSISIRFFYTGGVSVGFQKPIYYEILTFNSSGQIIASEEKTFDPSIHLYNYGGTASFTRGFNEMKVIPGLTVKTGLNFEYSEREPIIHALEAAIGFTIYPRNIQIMATDEVRFFFFNFKVGYRFGSMLDISEAAMAKSRKERRQKRLEAGSPVPQIF